MAASAGGRLRPANLTVEYRRSPILDVAPRFSWVPTAVGRGDARNLSQAAYQLQVFRVAPTGARPLLWDSGAVPSRRTLHVELPGSALPLASDAAYAWRVRLWSASGGEPSAYSANASFGTALLRQSDWRAPWIASDWEAQQLRLRFSLPAGKAVAQARVYAASGGYTVIFANGVNANAQNANARNRTR